MSDEYSPYILWQDVVIEEEFQTMDVRGSSVGVEVSTWTATFDGSVHVDDNINPYREPNVTFTRSGDTAMDAAHKLAVVANQQGWDIR